MINILEFKDFSLNESENYSDKVHIDKKTMGYFLGSGREKISRIIFNRFIASPKVDSVYFNDDGKLTIKMGDYTTYIPGITEHYGLYDINNAEEIRFVLSKLITKGIVTLSYLAKHTRPGFRWEIDSSIRLMDILMDNVLADSKSDVSPFDFDFKSTQIWKDLEKMDTSIVSTPSQIKKGTLVLQNEPTGLKIYIHSNGYMRSSYINSDRIGIFTSKPEYVKPINSEEDLMVKLKFIRSFLLNKILGKAGMLSREAPSIVNDLEMGDYSRYTKAAIDLISKNPELAAILPDFEDKFDKGIVKGATMLKRFGTFDDDET